MDYWLSESRSWKWKQVVSFGVITAECCVTCAVDPSLQNTAQRSVIPSGHASKQNVDLLMGILCRGSVTGLPLKILQKEEHWCSKQHGMFTGLWPGIDRDGTGHWQFKKKKRLLKPLTTVFKTAMLALIWCIGSLIQASPKMLHFLSVLGWRR